eukprot:11772175-Ditylum_brightwellii.AAC.1
MADVGHCWWQQQETTSNAPIEKAVWKMTRVGSNSKKLVAMATTRNKTVAMVTANQDGDAKPVKKEMRSRQEGACHA